MLVFYIFISLYISWIWVDYFRLIDVFDREKLIDLIGTFLLGCGSVMLVFLIAPILPDFLNLGDDSSPLKDFIYYCINVGLIEELSKTAAFLVALLFIRKRITEPLDYVIYMSLSALGFAATENVIYFYQHGSGIIEARAILCSVGHMIDTALIAYGVILYKYSPQKRGLWVIPLFIILAAISHGIYDFILISEIPGILSFIAAAFYFMITVSLFSTILNNSINNSPHFSYKKVIDPNKVSNRLFLYYAGVFGFQFLAVGLDDGWSKAMGGLFQGFISTAFIIIVTVLALSRFKLVKNRWKKLSIELPFKRRRKVDGSVAGGFEIKGETVNEGLINIYYHEHFLLIPLSRRASHLGRPTKVFLQEKYLLKNDDFVYEVSIQDDNTSRNQTRFYLKAKTVGNNLVDNQYPIVGIYLNPEGISNDKIHSIREFKILEWGYIKSLS